MVRKVTDFVYVVEHEEAANNVIIIGKRGVIIVDTSLFPEKARSIVHFVREFTLKPVELVFNTHYHPDHTLGNSSFTCPIVAHNLTREKMELFSTDYLREIGLEGIKIRKPDMIFDKSFIYEDGIKVEFIHGPGHTPDSSFAYIPSENVLVAGDLVINRIHPEIVSDSNLYQWLRTLENLPKVKHVIPGHGPVGDYSSIQEMIDYIDKIRRLIVGELSVNELEKSKNFVERQHPELLQWGIRNLTG